MAIHPMTITHSHQPHILNLPKILQHEETILIDFMRLVRYVASTSADSVELNQILNIEISHLIVIDLMT